MKDVNLGKTQSPVSPQQRWVVVGLTPKWHTFYILSDDTNIAGDILYRFGAIWLWRQLCSCNIEILNHLYLFNVGLTLKQCTFWSCISSTKMTVVVGLTQKWHTFYILSDDTNIAGDKQALGGEWSHPLCSSPQVGSSKGPKPVVMRWSERVLPWRPAIFWAYFQTKQQLTLS